MELINNGESGKAVRGKLNTNFERIDTDINQVKTDHIAVTGFMQLLSNAVADWQINFPYTDAAIKLYTDVAITITEVLGDVATWQYSTDGTTWNTPANYINPDINILAGIFYIKAVTFANETAIMVIKAVKS